MASSSGGYSGLRSSLNSQASGSGGYSGLRSSLNSQASTVNLSLVATAEEQEI